MKLFVSLFFLSLALVGLNAPSQSQPPAMKPHGLTDSVDVALPQSEKTHRYASRGRVARRIRGDFVGGHDMRRMARTVSAPGSWISYRLQVRADVQLTLEFEELEDRANDATRNAVRAYSIWVDGKRAYFRTAQASSAGPLHFWVQVPPVKRNVIDLRVQNEVETPFHLARIWAFADFSRYFESAGMAVPYHLAPTVALTFGDREADRQKLRAIKTSFGTHPRARAAWTMWIPYGNLSNTEIEQRLDYTLSLAQESDLPVQICFDTWWGSTPNGSDGQGGFWSDVRYHQVVYNQKQAKIQLSVPNRWGNTPWLTTNRPNLNAFKVSRLQTAMRMLQKRRLKLRTAGETDPVLAVNLDNEPVYWATGNAGLGNEILQADFNAATVEAARRDKITLDPTNGLDFGERLWLWRNLRNYQETIAAAAVGASREAIVVDATGARASGDPLRDNIYTQAMVANAALQFPMQNSAYPLWETGAPASARVGGEWNGDSVREREAVLHQLPLGRTAQVNAETGNRASEMVGVRPGYALGQRFYALYNYPHDKMDVAGSELRDTPRGLEPLIYQRVLREETFNDETWKSRAVASEGLERALIGNTTAMSLAPVSNAKPGYVTYRIDAAPIFQGLNIEFSGRAFVSQSKNPDVFIRVLAGSSQNVASMREVGKIFDSGDINAVHRFDLSAIANQQKAVFVRFELSADKLPPTVLNWAAIYHLRFTQSWPAAFTNDTFAQDESIDRQRQQNLLVSWRRDAELAIARLAKNTPNRTASGMPKTVSLALTQALQSAREAFDRGEYALATQRANQASSFTLPGAVYRVIAPGRLAPYPISIQSAAPLTFTLSNWNQDGVAFSLQSERDAPVKIEIGALSAGKFYSLLPGTQGLGSWILRPSRPSDASGISRLVADAAGNVSWTAPASSVLQPTAPPTLEGTFRAVWSQSPPVISFWRADGRGFERVSIGAKTQISRGEPGKETVAAFDQLQRGDDITIFCDADGNATRVVAGTRTLQGVVAEIAPLTPHTMPFVRLQGSETRHIIDLSAPLSIPDSGGALVSTSFRAAPLGTVALKAGDLVKVRVNPRSNRVFELWKTQTATP